MTLAVALGAAVSFSASCAPLLMEGKTTIYRRVLTTPACMLKQNAADPKGQSVPAFTRFYVYKDDGKDLEVGPDTSGKISGVLSKDCTVDWNMQMALMFTNPANRNRALIFKSKDALQALVDDPEPQVKVSSMMQSLAKKETIPGVISAEPENYVDYKKNFYLLPILDFEETMFDDGNYVRELKVASVTAEDKSSGNAASEENALKTFKAAVVFVIDSSISMQPYIDRTKQTINTIVKKIAEEQLSDSVHFGLISFRSSTKAVPGLDYVSKIFVTPGDAKDVETFNKKLASLNQATVSSKYFDEDSLAGISSALDKISWKNYGGRYVVLITDAGAIKGSDKLSSTGLDTAELRSEARHKGVAIYAMHLLTDSGKRNNNHEKAKNQYLDLTFNDTVNKSLYYPVNAGDVKNFGRKIDELSDNIASQVKDAAFGKSAIGAAASESQSEENKTLNEDTKALGHAMRLAYLGERLGTKAPSFLKGWLGDRDLAAHDKVTSTPVVLLTKDELSSLKDVTQKILDSANEGILNPETMFNQLRSVAVSMGRDPSTIGSEKTLKLGELNLLGEYLEGLPYRSHLQELDEESWSSMGPDEQNQQIADLESKLKYYQQCNDDSERWVKLNDKEDISQAVYPIPLEVLP